MPCQKHGRTPRQAEHEHFFALRLPARSLPESTASNICPAARFWIGAGGRKRGSLPVFSDRTVAQRRADCLMQALPAKPSGSAAFPQRNDSPTLLPSDSRADEHEQAEFTSAVSKMPVVHVMRPYSASGTDGLLRRSSVLKKERRARMPTMRARHRGGGCTRLTPESCPGIMLCRSYRAFL